MKNQTSQTETLLYGTPIGKSGMYEEILYQCRGYTDKDELLKKGKEWADKNGYDRLRISVVDLTTPPDFIGAINI